MFHLRGFSDLLALHILKLWLGQTHSSISNNCNENFGLQIACSINILYYILLPPWMVQPRGMCFSPFWRSIQNSVFRIEPFQSPPCQENFGSCLAGCWWSGFCCHWPVNPGFLLLTPWPLDTSLLILSLGFEASLLMFHSLDFYWYEGNSVIFTNVSLWLASAVTSRWSDPYTASESECSLQKYHSLLICPHGNGLC